MNFISELSDDAVDAIADDLIGISREIHSHPELAFAEHHAYAQLVPFVKSHGFAVTEHAYGMETAFRGDSGQGTPTIAICVALRRAATSHNSTGSNVALSSVITQPPPVSAPNDAPAPSDAEWRAKLPGWREQRVLAVSIDDARLTWPERELIRQLGEKLYGDRNQSKEARR